MTYYYSKYSKPDYYDFTAFTELDLQDAGVHGQVSSGDMFTMPASATLCITVKDNDKSLSGDYHDHASDRSYQTASISLGEEGPEQGNGGQIYAEKYFWLCGDNGQYYLLIEIEQEGSAANYYTFHDSYGMPAAGTKLTVLSDGEVCGDWVTYKDLGAGECSPPVHPDCITIEAEDMHLYGYSVQHNPFASGGEIVAGSYCGKSYAQTKFEGETGTYDLSLCVVDEDDGQGFIKIYINDQLVSITKLDEDTGGAYGETGVFREIKLDDIELKTGDKITIKGISDKGEFARLDKIEICKDKAPLLGKLGDLVFFDADRDGVQDAGEAGVEGITVQLKDASGTVIGTTVTDADGTYLFDGLEASDYSVAFVLPEDYVFTVQDAGGDDALDSDADPATGMTQVVTLGEGETNLTLDAGIVLELGSLSGRYFCDTNDNDQDDGNGDEPGIGGVVVELLDATGNGTGITTATADDGTYRFDDLAPGTYGVAFTDPNNVLEGKVLVDANVGDDASDSDAIGDTTRSVITGIEVLPGDDTPDNDAGVEEDNAPPEPHDDLGKGCADEIIFVDVLANDSDPEDGPLTVHAVNGIAIAEGETITIDDVGITLTGGTLSFDGETAYADLDIGEEATATYSYTVKDAEGATAEADIGVTFCGDANSVESFIDSLPTSGTYEVIAAERGSVPFEDFAYDLRFLETGDDRFDGVLIEEAYCLDFNTALRTISDGGPENIGDIFGAQSAAALAAFDANTVSNANGLAGSENLDLINWIISQNFESQGFSGFEVQFAVWELADDFDSSLVNYNAIQNTEQADVEQILNAALQQDGFEFSAGNTIGAIVDPSDAQDPDNVQPFIVGLNWETYDCLC